MQEQLEWKWRLLGTHVLGEFIASERASIPGSEVPEVSLPSAGQRASRLSRVTWTAEWPTLSTSREFESFPAKNRGVGVTGRRLLWGCDSDGSR